MGSLTIGKAQKYHLCWALPNKAQPCWAWAKPTSDLRSRLTKTFLLKTKSAGQSSSPKTFLLKTKSAWEEGATESPQNSHNILTTVPQPCIGPSTSHCTLVPYHISKWTYHSKVSPTLHRTKQQGSKRGLLVDWRQYL